MIVEDQRELIAFLTRPGAYGEPDGTPVERIETHSAVVFLAGARAYKLKRAVRYDYLDFSTVERRRASCEAEIARNRRTAPTLYEDCVPVTRDAAKQFALGGSGVVVDWLVRMRRFPDADLLDRIAARGALQLSLMPRLAAAIVRLHRAAEPRPDRGGRAGMEWVVAGNEQGLADEGAAIFDERVKTRVIAATRRQLTRLAPLLDARRRDGYVRVCHGDLHLGNIVLLDGEPTLFDAIEFSEDISCIDVLYDLAFLLTDLWRLQLRRHANAVFNAYVAATFTSIDEYAALGLLPLFLSCRSTVRAKTSATASRLQSDEGRALSLAGSARVYLAESDDLLHPPPPRIVAIGGASGTGKSTVARLIGAAVGAAPGAVVLRTDAIRKQMCGVSESTRLGAAAYADDMNLRVYRELEQRASAALQAGHGVVADGVFARARDRERMEAIASGAGVPFDGIWLEAQPDRMAARLAGRRDDASDATADVLAGQLAGIEPGTWPVVDANGGPDAVADRAAALLAHRR